MNENILLGLDRKRGFLFNAFYRLDIVSGSILALANTYFYDIVNLRVVLF